ncbi:MAG TPA: LacI family DNA-binding transcriptional regulator [Candidatus Acidoferrales bacterium]|nr:LacI family DNA-binding transcriptional regulator [Candidatus Acidoferrales bacterium]
MKRSTHKPHRSDKRPVTLRAVADRVKLTASTVSHVLNDSPAARSVPDETKKRIFKAARELNYHPNFFARSLKVRKSYTVGVIAEEIGDAYGSLLISGIERYLRGHNFFFLTVAHRHDPKLLATYSHMLRQRGAEGFITVDTVLTEEPVLPTVAIAGHRRFKGVTNVILNHRRAAFVALKHLVDLGHERIAFMKGSQLSSDSDERWRAICETAAKLGLRIRPELVMQLQGVDPTPNLGYPVAKQLLAKQEPFTALFAYNDISAIGSIFAFEEAGLSVPEDISVVGFDDIQNAAYINPALTTVRQPLLKMGEIAAKTLLDRLERRTKYVAEITIEPELVVRKSTAPANNRRVTHVGTSTNGAKQS